MKGSRNNRGLAKLFKKHKGKCFYCGCQTILLGVGQDLKLPNVATTEHLYSRLDLRRILSDKTVLACAKCNMEKGYEDYKTVFNNSDYTQRQYNLDEGWSIYEGMLIEILKTRING